LLNQEEALIIIGDNDFQVRVVVDVTDTDVQAVTAVSAMSLAVEVRIAAGSAAIVVAGPGRGGGSGRLVGCAVGVIDKDLCPAFRCRFCLGGGGDYFNAAVAVQVSGSQSAYFR
jgi:hypothetical protein